MADSEWTKFFKSAINSKLDLRANIDCPDISGIIGVSMKELTPEILDHILFCQDCMSLYRLTYDSQPLQHTPEPNWLRLDLKVRSRILWHWVKTGLNERIGRIQDILSSAGNDLQPATLRQFGTQSQSTVLRFDPETLRIPDLLPNIVLLNLSGLTLQDTMDHITPELDIRPESSQGVIRFTNLDPALSRHESFLLIIPEVELRLLIGADNPEDTVKQLRQITCAFSERPSPSDQAFFQDLFTQSFVLKNNVSKPANNDTALVEFIVEAKQFPGQLQSSKIWILVLGQRHA